MIGVYGGLLDKFPAGAWMNRSLTLRTGQCHVQRYMKPLLQRIESGEIEPTCEFAAVYGETARSGQMKDPVLERSSDRSA